MLIPGTYGRFIGRAKLFDGIALLSGGAYAEWVTVPKTHVMQMPKKLTYKEVLLSIM